MPKMPPRLPQTHLKTRFLGMKGFSKRPSNLIFSSAFSAAAARPLCAPPDSLAIRSVCRDGNAGLC